MLIRSLALSCALALASPALLAQEAAADAPATAAAATGETGPATPAPATEPVSAKPANQPPAHSMTLPHDLSPWGMFMAADWVVKTVMIGLALASVITWTIWLAKNIELNTRRRRSEALLAGLGRVRTLPEALQQLGDAQITGAVMARAAATELEMSAEVEAHDKDGIKERVASRLDRIEAAAGRRMIRGTGMLATIGATAPFVGLFGTVWGIMNSFIGISQSQTTNLAVVAPGIAEALLATAIGLVAAIPAVVIYNVFSRSIAGYKALLADTSAEVMRLVSRDLDRDVVPQTKRLKAVD